MWYPDPSEYILDGPLEISIRQDFLWIAKISSGLRKLNLSSQTIAQTNNKLKIAVETFAQGCADFFLITSTIKPYSSLVIT